MTDASHPPAGPLKETPLHPLHARLGAKLVPFNGWEMPLYFSGILDEHRAVRSNVGLFDVGHMGILTVSGVHAPDLLGRRTTANAAKIVPGQCKYTFLTDASGTIVDDLLATRLDLAGTAPPEFLVVPNAGTTARVREILVEHRRPDTELALHNGKVTILAVQGPRSKELLESLFGWSLGELKFYHAKFFPTDPASALPKDGALGELFPEALGRAILVSRTGYTGELGFELFVPGDRAIAIAERILAAGATPCGLGARDTLRLEKGYLLSGQEFNRDRTPFEAAQDRFVELDHPFIGKDVLEAQKRDGVKVRLAGIALAAGAGIPRHGTPVIAGDQVVATATSGGLSPTLGYGIALAFLPRPLDEIGTRVGLEIRGKTAEGTVVKLPFLPAKPPPRANT